MSTSSIDNFVRTFRRQIMLSNMIRLLLIMFFFTMIIWSSMLPEARHKQVLLLLSVAVMLIGVWIIFSATRLHREVRTGSVLLASGQLDDAETWFLRAIKNFSLVTKVKIVAGQQLASLFFQREAHNEVIAICRELLRHRLNRVRSVLVNTRLLLADSLLLMDRVSEAYEVLQPVYDYPLSLAERMKLLPIQLRYELAADHSDSAVRALSEKIRIAELLDSSRAALVHALLAEACRRESLTAQHQLLAERARLYCDLEPLAERYAVIAPIAECADSSSPNEPAISDDK